MLLLNTVRKWLGLVDHTPVQVKPRRHRGHPYQYPTSVIIRCYLLMLVLPQLRQHATLHKYLQKHALVRRAVGLNHLPHRTTLSRRFQALESELKARIWAMGWAFILAGYVQVHILLADGTLYQASGPSWPAKYKKQGILPAKLRHVDTAAGWGHSPYHGWVWGYRTHPVVGLTADLQPIPLLAEATPADVQDNTLLEKQLPWLPSEATVMLLDSGYEDEALMLAWQQTDDHGVHTRWMIIDPKQRKGRPSPWRQQLQVRRALEEVDLYKLRGKLIEPFFGRWKDAFDLDVVPLQGRAAPVFLLLALYGYQLLLWDHLHTGRPLYAYQHLFLGDD